MKNSFATEYFEFKQKFDEKQAKIEKIKQKKCEFMELPSSFNKPNGEMIELMNQLQHKQDILDYHKVVKTELEECFKDKII